MKEDKEIVAQGSIDYNRRTIAYIVSKSGNNYFIEISFVKGSKQDESDKTTKFEFNKQEDGKFYLDSKEAPFFHNIFIEENGLNRSLVLAKGKKEISRLSVFQNEASLNINGKILPLTLTQKGADINLSSIIKMLGISDSSKIKDIASKFLEVVKNKISEKTR